MFPPSTAATNREAHAFDEGDSRGPGDQQRDARCGQPAAACTCIRHHLHRLSLGSVIPYPPIPHTCQVVKVFASLAPTPEIGRAHVCTPVTTAHLVCRLRLDKKK